MRRRRLVPGPAVFAVVAVMVAAGCGIPVDDEPEALAGGVVSAALTPSATAGTTTSGGPRAEPTEEIPVYLIRGGRAVAVSRHRSGVGVAAALELLLAGPTQEEVAAGLRTAIAPGTRLRSVQLSDGIVLLDLTSAFVEVGGEEQILAVAQIVLTATARPTVDRVSFALDGQVVEVPRSDGTLAAGPLTADDYEPLREPAGDEGG